MKVITNTTQLIVLERIGYLDILKNLYGQIIRPQSVLDELLAGREKYSLAMSLVESDWINTHPDPPEMTFRRELGAGETAAITLAFKLEADLTILDDLQARLVAQNLGLKITGTLGVLGAAHKAGIISDPSLTMMKLKKAGFRLPSFCVDFLK